MMNLYDKMVMDSETVQAEAKARRKYFKHIGELKQDQAKVAILFRTVPNEPENCLVVGPKFLSDNYHNDFMKALESDEGQSSFELGTYIGRVKFSDGVDMLAFLHNDGFIKKMPTKDVVVVYGPGEEGKISLDKLNQLIADERGTSIAGLTVQETSTKTSEKTEKKTKTVKKANAKKTAKV